MLPEGEELPIPGHDEAGAAFERRGDVLVVIRSNADPDIRGVSHEIGQNQDVLEPERGIQVAADEPF